MTQLLYAMQFKGQATPGPAPGVLKAATRSPSSRLTSLAGPCGLESRLECISGGEAEFESTVTFVGDSHFVESGSIRFGDGHVLRFSTVDQGFLGGSADANLKHGAVMWRIDGGEGQFEGASGIITSNFTVGEAGEVVDNHFGVIFTR
jgi:hypothetical protein